MDFKNQELKPLEKLRVKYRPYYRTSDWEYRLTPPDGQVYLVNLQTFADLNKSLIDIFLYFFNSIYEGTQSKEQVGDLNAVLKYMIDLYHLNDKYIPPNVKTTEESNMYLWQIQGNYQNDKVQEYLKKSKNEIDNQISKSQRDIETVRRVRSKIKEKHLRYILNLPTKTEEQRKIRAIYIPSVYEQTSQIYVNKLLNTVSYLQFTKKKYRLYKLKHFQKTYQSFLQPILRKKTHQYPKQLTIKRYTLISNVKNYHMSEVLISLGSLFQIAKQHQDQFKFSYIELMRQLGNELKRHNSETKQFYPFLNPKNIILNQISLKIHLSYQMPLLSALGLLKMPMSTQQMICFAATPQIFDFFSAPNEHLQIQNQSFGTSEQIFHDLHYGIDKLIQLYDEKYKSQFSGQKKGRSMDDVKQKHYQISQTWRFIMIFSYLMNGEHYFKKNIKGFYDYSIFKKFLKEQLVKFESDPITYTKTVLGKKPSLEKIRLKQTKQLSLQMFDDFLSDAYTDSQLSNSPSKYYKINRFLTTKGILKKDIQDILLKQTVNCKMNNPTRYLLLFYIDIFDNMFNIHMLFTYYLINIKIGQEMFDQIGGRIRITKFGQIQDKKSKIELSFSKLEQYKMNLIKGKKSETIRLTMKKYEEIYNNVSTYRDNYLKLKSEVKQILQEIQKEQTKPKIVKIIEQVIPIIAQCQIYIKAILAQQSGKQERSKIFEYSLQIKMRVLLIINLDNFIDMDSMVIPFLNIKGIVEINQQEDRVQNFEPIYNQSIEKYEYILELVKDYEGKYNKHFRPNKDSLL